LILILNLDVGFILCIIIIITIVKMVQYFNI